jgi:uncharacterized LabA/DUF88 family protein
MRILILIDGNNFIASVNNVCKERKCKRSIDYYKLHHFILEYLKNNPNFNSQKLHHLRTYFYTGEYSYSTISRIEYECQKSKFKEKVKKDFCHAKKAQLNFFKKAKEFNFFEIRTKPLQYTQKNGVFQKGVDVQIAVDMASFAYQDNYDVIVLLSGDVDLLESAKLIKSLGKQLVIMAHYKTVSEEMKRISDLYIELNKLHDKQLDQFSHLAIA